MQCKKCKKDIPDESMYCLFCGAPQKRDKKKKLYQRPDGLFEKVLTVNGKRIAFRGRSEPEINRKILEFQEKQQAGRLFQEVAEEWESEHFPTLSYNSTRNYAPALQRAIDYFGDDPIKQITPSQVNTFIGKFAREGWAQKTVQTQLLVLNLIFSKSVIDGDIETSPSAYIRTPKNLSKSKREPPAKEQIEIVKQNLSLPFGLFPYFLLYTGCRLGEALALQFKDIDIGEGIIHINKSIYYVGNSPHIKEPKTQAGIREVILLEKLKKVIPKGKPDYFLFSESDKPLTQSQFRVKWNQYCKAVGLSEKRKDQKGNIYYVSAVTPHQFRHAYATMLFEAGVEAKDAQELLGHSDIAVTENIYTHIRESRKEKTAEILNDFEG